MVHVALLLLMLEAAANANLVSTISQKRNTPFLQLSTSGPADYPIFQASQRHHDLGHPHKGRKSGANNHQRCVSRRQDRDRHANGCHRRWAPARNFRRSNLSSRLCRRVVDLHKPGQLGGIGIRLSGLQTRRKLIFDRFFVTTQVVGCGSRNPQVGDQACWFCGESLEHIPALLFCR